MKKKHISLLLLVGFSMVVLAGCSSSASGTPVEITADTEGFWNHFFVWPLSWLITTVAKYTGGYGVAIIIVTVLVRLCLVPLMVKQIRSTKAMQALQPEMKRLKEQYSSKDQATQQKLQQETMALYKTHGVNPLAGCLPLLIQMPILIAFYQAIIRTTEISEHTFLWFDLGSPDPYFILPILAGVTTYISQRISMLGQDQSGPMASQMKIMMYIMPAMILFFALNLPAALSLYWVVGNIFSAIQTYIIKGPDIKAAALKKNGR